MEKRLSRKRKKVTPEDLLKNLISSFIERIKNIFRRNKREKQIQKKSRK